MVDAGSAQPICEGSTVQLNASVSNSTIYLWNTSGGDGAFDDNTALNAVYTPGNTDISNGTATLTLTAQPTSPCTATVSDQVVINISRAPAIGALTDREMCSGETLPPLSATITNNGIFFLEFNA